MDGAAVTAVVDHLISVELRTFDDIVLADSQQRSARETAKLLLAEMHDKNPAVLVSDFGLLRVLVKLVDASRSKTAVAPLAAGAPRSRDEDRRREDSSFSTQCFQKLRETFGIVVHPENKATDANMKKIDDGFERGMLGRTIVGLEAGLTVASAAASEEKIDLGHNVTIGLTGDAASTGDTRRLSEFHSAVLVTLLAMLAVGCKPANATGFNSRGDEGFLVGAGGGRVQFIMAPDIVFKVLAWTYAISADHNGIQATERWGQMALRAGQLCTDELTVGSALVQSCREHGRAFITRIPSSPAPKAGERSDAEKVPYPVLRALACLTYIDALRTLPRPTRS
jgi:hypothetical protein